MLIDQYLPNYHVSRSFSTTIAAPADVVYKQIFSLDMGQSPIVRMLFKLRGMPSSAMTFDGLESMRFVHLGQIEDKEILMGLVGKFWTLNGGLLKVTPAEFEAFDEEGYARVAWGFNLKKISDDSTELSTETRIQCTDAKSARKFGRYWRLVGPFSGWIRKETLSLIKRDAERQQ